MLDLSSGSRLQGEFVADLDVASLDRLIGKAMRDAGTFFAFGRYGEPRELYRNDDFVDTENGEPRTIHLGIDLFCAAGTPVYAPLGGSIEIVSNNNRELDYGPMVVMRHQVRDRTFFTLYGHLSLSTLDRVGAGQQVAAGAQIAAVGEPPTNGNWPPHLHMQLIDDLLGLGAAFPGVAPKSQREYWFNASPSPAGFFPELAASELEYPC